METVIKKAIEGGYDCLIENWKRLEEWQSKAIVLDPLFWQALGKSCGWETASQIECACGREISNWKSVWIINSLKFHEINLTEGWDKAVEYLEDLIR